MLWTGTNMTRFRSETVAMLIVGPMSILALLWWNMCSPIRTMWFCHIVYGCRA